MKGLVCEAGLRDGGRLRDLGPVFVIGAYFHDRDVWFQVLSSDVDVVAGGTGLIFSTVGVFVGLGCGLGGWRVT